MGLHLSLSLPILILAAAIQSSFIPQIRILGGSPDLVLLTVLCWSIDSELDEALTWAFVGGIVQDLMSAAPLGTSALGLVLIVFMVWRLSQGVFRVGPLLLTALVVAGTVIHQTVFALVLAVVGLPGNFLNLFSYVIVPSAVYNLAVVAFVYLIVRQLQKRLRPKNRTF